MCQKKLGEKMKEKNKCPPKQYLSSEENACVACPKNADVCWENENKELQVLCVTNYGAVQGQGICMSKHIKLYNISNRMSTWMPCLYV